MSIDERESATSGFRRVGSKNKWSRFVSSSCLSCSLCRQRLHCFDAVSGKSSWKTRESSSVSRAEDIGHISYYGEVVIQGCQITQGMSIPVIRNGDNVYRNAMNVRRTVKGCIQSGFAGIIPEDQMLR
ncbi:hypothetical protein OPV22_021407 [Ensete ventricosum]|uniref:Uncharacterized protein n=1 Tax=Ensete ventricosum TaxID=4639 RepID=A0AAV8PB21_ENSVE|nr:hypothetical protein OPV22_021407 [Ensete ventricosum]